MGTGHRTGKGSQTSDSAITVVDRAAVVGGRSCVSVRWSATAFLGGQLGSCRRAVISTSQEAAGARSKIGRRAPESMRSPVSSYRQVCTLLHLLALCHFL